MKKGGSYPPFAERVGFEPTVPSRVLLISSQVQSTNSAIFPCLINTKVLYLSYENNSNHIFLIYLS